MACSCKITGVKVKVVEVPLHKQWQISLYSAKTRKHVVVELSTSSGVVGYGEASPSPAFMGEGADSVACVLERYLVPVVLGVEVFDLEELHSKMDAAIAGNEAAKSALDMAAYDAAGKALGEPAYRLIGGKTNNGKVPLSWVVGIQEDEGAVEEAQRYASMGFPTIKLKVGKDPERDVRLVRSVARALGGGVRIRLDANQGYDVSTAVRVITQLEETVELECVEQPVPRWDIEGLRTIRNKVRTPVMVDEAVFGPHDILRIAAAGACDVLNIKIGKVGGIWPAKKVAAIAESAGIHCAVGSNLELSIGSAAGLHFAASTSIVTYPSDLLIGPWLHEHDIVERSLADLIKDGFASVPEIPGLGVVCAVTF
ncbi:MAG: mandelate racemase/muconate lactonizing enzyme family protein [Bacillota bacterium]